MYEEERQAKRTNRKDRDLYSEYLQELGKMVNASSDRDDVFNFICRHLGNVSRGVIPVEDGLWAFMQDSDAQLVGASEVFANWLKARGFGDGGEVWTKKRKQKLRWKQVVWQWFVPVQEDKVVDVTGDIETLVWYTSFEVNSTTPTDAKTIRAEMKQTHETLAKFGLWDSRRIAVKHPPKPPNRSLTNRLFSSDN